jgi:hypothetical protein
VSSSWYTGAACSVGTAAADDVSEALAIIVLILAPLRHDHGHNMHLLVVALSSVAPSWMVVKPGTDLLGAPTAKISIGFKGIEENEKKRKRQWR